MFTFLHNGLPVEAVDKLSLWGDMNRQIWWFGLCLVISLGILRLALLRAYTPKPVQCYGWDLLRTFWRGCRFDAKWVAFGLSPWLLLSLVSLMFPLDVLQGVYTLWPLWALLVAVAFDALGMVNHGYFGFYHRPLDGLVFGFFEDNTRAILATVWKEYPVVGLFIGMLAILLFQFAFMLLGGFLEIPAILPSHPYIMAALIISCSVLGCAFLMRGSMGKFPLREMHLEVSSDQFLNYIVPNGVLNLYLAYRARRATDLGDDPLCGLRHFGFDSPISAARQLGWQVDSDADVMRHMFTRIPPNPVVEAHPPLVMVNLMEAWGQAPLAFDEQTRNDLLGHMRPWLHERGLYFDRVLSVDNGTNPSIEGILFDTPISPLLQTRYGYRMFNTSAALPYQQAGYRVVYLTAGSVSWRDLGKTLKREGFDEVIGANAIIERFPNATSNTWGVDDEWMFLYAEELLLTARKNSQKLMLFTQSCTNHPPYRVPPGYTPGPLDISLGKGHYACCEELQLSIESTYQYAMDTLGNFYDRLHDAGVLDNTLVAATGDHNIRSLFKYPDDMHVDEKYGVPILLLIPSPYQGEEVPDTHMWAAHRDIFQTLWAHSLSNTVVPCNGRDLLSPSEIKAYDDIALSFNKGGMLVSDEGAVTQLNGRMRYLQRQNDGFRLMEHPNTVLQHQADCARAHMALKDWRIRIQALGLDPLTENAEPKSYNKVADGKSTTMPI